MSFVFFLMPLLVRCTSLTEPRHVTRTKCVVFAISLVDHPQILPIQKAYTNYGRPSLMYHYLMTRVLHR